MRQYGILVQEPLTEETANRSLPMFRQAASLFEQGKGYADRTASIDYAVYAENTLLYIEIQDAIILRANRNN